MTIQNIIREAVRAELARRGQTLSSLAKENEVDRQVYFDRLAGRVTDKTIDLFCGHLEMDRAAFERLILDEWKKAIDSGCDVEPPQMAWRNVAPTRKGMEVVQ